MVLFVLRLIHITQAPLEVAHNWRQTTVTMVARNFLEVDNNIFYPRLDIAGEKTGITGMEFPLLNYLIYLLSLLFGYAHWYGRLIVLIISSIASFLFYKTVKKNFDEGVAFKATFILLVSLWFSYSRKIMPDVFSLSFIVMSLYYATVYFENKRMLDILLFLFFACIGTLSKLTSGYLLVLLVLFLFKDGVSVKTKIIFSALFILSIIPALWWYFQWVPYVTEANDFKHFFMGMDIGEGALEIKDHLALTLKRFYDTAMKYSGFAVFVVGFAFMLIKRQKLLLFIFFLPLGAFLVVIFKAGYGFSRHTYYILPFVPVMAIVAAYGLNQLKNSRLVVLVLTVVATENIIAQLPDFRVNDTHVGLLHLESDLDKIAQPQDLILINSTNYPTPMYFAHHKGWIESNEKIQDEKYISELKSKGLKHIVVLKKAFGSEVKLTYKTVLENEDYCIYSL